MNIKYIQKLENKIRLIVIIFMKNKIYYVFIKMVKLLSKNLNPNNPYVYQVIFRCMKLVNIKRYLGMFNLIMFMLKILIIT